MICNRTELADLIGCAKTSIDSWVAEGAPVVRKEGRKGIESQYNSRDFIKWLIDREKTKAAARANTADLDQLRAEKIRAETRLKELQLAREAGEVLPLRQFEQTLATVLSSIRAVMLSLPQRAAMRLVGETDSARISAALKEEVNAALSAGADAYTAAVEEQYPEVTADEC